MNKQITMIIELPGIKETDSEEINKAIKDRLINNFAIDGISTIKSLHINAKEMIADESIEDG